MYTFRALSLMKPGHGDLDPRMYHYGGLWFYPIGALLKLASVAGVVHLTSDPAYYIDHPEAFARFYLLGRLYVVAWAVVGAWAVYRIACQLCRGWAAPITAVACFALLPVVVNMSHEVKPHLPGMVLVLLSVLAAAAYVRDGGWRRAARAGAACGLATGTILTGGVALTVLPLMVCLRPDRLRTRWRALAVSAAAAMLCYALTNPYVLIRLVKSRALLAGNAAGLGGFYNLSNRAGAFRTASRLILEGATPGLIAIAAFGAILFAARLIARTRRPRSPLAGGRVSPLAWLLLAPAAANAAHVFAFAGGKPGEYGRFALLLNVGIAILAVRSVAYFVKSGPLCAVVLLMLPLCALPGALRYLTNFIRDAGPYNSRLAEARRLAEVVAFNRDPAAAPEHRLTLGITADPAPYCMPPVDLWRWRVLLVPRGMTLEDAARANVADVLLQAVDEPGRAGQVIGDYVELPPALRPVSPPAVISWAGKPFRLLARRTLDVP
jgi:hypothetical protein